MWDGLETTSEDTVVVMGATNRPRDVDRAILRRMPATFHVGLPNQAQRRAIFMRVMAMEPADKVDANIDYIRLSQLTEGFSGSDIRLVRAATSVAPFDDYIAIFVLTLLLADSIAIQGVFGICFTPFIWRIFY